MSATFDRAAEDLGNIVGLEHVNVQIDDQRLSTIFYVMGLGLTRDPYLQTGIGNMWINVGRSQFHLPTGTPQVVRGRVGLVLPDREALLERLTKVKGELDGTQFSFTEGDDYVDATSPWGNRLRLHEPDPRFGPRTLGMPYVQFDVPVGTAAGIAKFYKKVLGSDAKARSDKGGAYARCPVGQYQDLIFRETDAPIPDYDGHHLQVYLANFSSPHAKLAKLGLVTEESDQFQYRFKDIVDTDSGKVLFTIEHEVRSMTHPLFGRPLVNRNPYQTNQAFAPGHEDWRLVPA